MTYHFDSQAFVRRMQAAGMERGIAEKPTDALGSVVLDGLVTKRDLSEGFDRADGRLRESLKDLELRMTLRLGALLAGATTLIVAILGALITLR